MDRSDSNVDTDYRDADWAADQSWDPAMEDSAIADAPDALALDERRLHVRAYNLWASLLDGRTMPAITDLDPADLQDFGPASLLLNFDEGIENPKIVFLGPRLREECGIDGPISALADVPPRSLLSRLTDHYLQIIANSAPIGFEAEFANQRGIDVVYRGILMPFSSNGTTIDYIYGVLSWKEVADHGLTHALAREVEAALRSAPAPVAAGSPWDDVVDASGADSLADRLAAARESASEAADARLRSHQALYEAIGAAYDFALAADADPESFADLMEDAGIPVQPRAPMTAIAKLVFGCAYDKTRLAEIALALEHGKTIGLTEGAMTDYLAAHPGGLKGLVAKVRMERRPGLAADDGLGRAQAALAAVQALPWDDIPIVPGDIGVVVARREADGSLALVATLDDETLVNRVIRRIVSD